MVDKIKHIFVVLVFPTKSVLKQHVVHNIYSFEWGPMLVGHPATAQMCPCVETALIKCTRSEQVYNF